MLTSRLVPVHVVGADVCGHDGAVTSPVAGATKPPSARAVAIEHAVVKRGIDQPPGRNVAVSLVLRMPRQSLRPESSSDSFFCGYTEHGRPMLAAFCPLISHSITATAP